MKSSDSGMYKPHARGRCNGNNGRDMKGRSQGGCEWKLETSICQWAEEFTLKFKAPES